MASILQQESKKAHSLKELILQPQSEVPIFRTFLKDAGYEIVAEDIVEEEGKFYPMMKVVPVNENQDESDADKSNVDKTNAGQDSIDLKSACVDNRNCDSTKKVKPGKVMTGIVKKLVSYKPRQICSAGYCLQRDIRS